MKQFHAQSALSALLTSFSGIWRKMRCRLCWTASHRKADPMLASSISTPNILRFEGNFGLARLARTVTSVIVRDLRRAKQQHAIMQDSR
jgi:hypothetical protein